MQVSEITIDLTWESDISLDLDLHVVSVSKLDNSTCRTYYDNRTGCNQIRKELENNKNKSKGKRSSEADAEDDLTNKICCS